MTSGRSLDATVGASAPAPVTAPTPRTPTAPPNNAMSSVANLSFTEPSLRRCLPRRHRERKGAWAPRRHAPPTLACGVAHREGPGPPVTRYVVASPGPRRSPRSRSRSRLNCRCCCCCCCCCCWFCSCSCDCSAEASFSLTWMEVFCCSTPSWVLTATALVLVLALFPELFTLPPPAPPPPHARPPPPPPWPP